MNIVNFKNLDIDKKRAVYNFIKDVTPNYSKTFDETNSSLQSDLYSFGESTFISYEDNIIKGAMAVITKEIPIKQEAYINVFYIQTINDELKVYLDPENEEVFLKLLKKSIEYCITLKATSIKFGILNSLEYFIPYIEKVHFSKVYNAIIMKYTKNEAPILSNEIKFIPLSYSNAPLYQSIHNKAFQHSPNGGTITMDEVKDYISSYESQPDFVGLCSVSDNICGAYQLCTDDGVGWIDTLAVHPDYQNKGIGYLILNQCINKLYKSNVNSIKLLVITSNINAVNLYSKNGFEKESTFSTWFKYSANGYEEK